jgi:hypothetical protein
VLKLKGYSADVTRKVFMLSGSRAQLSMHGSENEISKALLEQGVIFRENASRCWAVANLAVFLDAETSCFQLSAASFTPAHHHRCLTFPSIPSTFPAAFNRNFRTTRSNLSYVLGGNIFL